MSLWLERPWALLALLPLAWLLWRGWGGDGATDLRRVVDSHLQRHVLTGALRAQRRLGLARAVAALLAVLALAGPYWQHERAPTLRNAALRVIVFDLSPGMSAHLQHARIKLLALLSAMPPGETALVVYAEEPYLVVPPTTDARLIAHFVPELAPEIMPVSGDRPERALRMASDLVARGGRHGQVVWMTATPLPGQYEVKGARLLPHQFGAAPGPHALAASTDDADIRALVTALDADQAATHAVIPGGIDLGPWLLLPLLLVLAVGLGRVPYAAFGCAIVAGGLWPQPLLAAGVLADAHALYLYHRGEYAAAARTFSNVHWQAAASYRAGLYEQTVRLLEAKSDARSHYNRGNALAQLGRLQQALHAYEAALAVDPTHVDARHNRDLLHSMLQGDRSGSVAMPPPRTPEPTPSAQAEASALAEQWLRAVPDQPAALLQRKLAIEHERRKAGKAERPW